MSANDLAYLQKQMMQAHEEQEGAGDADAKLAAKLQAKEIAAAR